MAISNALAWQLNNGGSADTLYGIIRDFLATSPDAATTQAQMAQYGISGEDVANATGGASGGLLGGNILAGASWNSLNPTLAGQLTKATGQATSNYSVGGATTADTLAQLNTFLAGGGQFDPNATVYLQTGGVDFLQGVDKGTIKNNINQIVKALGAQGVDVVLTGSPYAKSIDDVISNNFDPKVDSLFTEIAKENKNVALVGIQGEILQNKALLIDALHTNAEGTAIYNQAVIDSLSQFKNKVPSSTPQAIAQANQTNTVATTPPIITQAAASPSVAQAMKRVIPTARGTVIEGDDIEAQIAGVPQVVYETRVDPNNTANWETFNPTTGEVIDSGTFAGGGDRGLLAAAAPVIGLAAGTVGLPFITSLLGGATGLTGSALAGATGATISGATNAIAGGNAQDILQAALLGGAGAFGGSAISDYLKYQDVPIDFTNMTADQINDALDVNFANDLSRAGLTDTQIKSLLANPASVYDATQAVTTPSTVTTPVTDTVTVTAPTTTPSLTSLLDTITTPAVTVTAPKTTQTVDQATLDLIASQLATNVTKPANLATVNVTGDKIINNDKNTLNTILGLTPPSTTTPSTTTPIKTPTVTVEDKKEPAPIIDTFTPTTTTTTTPTTTPTVTVTDTKTPTISDIISSIITPSVVTPSIVTPPVTPPTTPTVTVTDTKTPTLTDIISSIVNPVVTPAPTVTPTVTVTDRKEPLPIIDTFTPTITPTITQPVTPTVTVTDTKEPAPIIDIFPPRIPPVTPPITPTVTVTDTKTPTITDIISSIINPVTPTVTVTDTKTPPVVLPPVIPPVVTPPTIPTVVIDAPKDPVVTPPVLPPVIPPIVTPPVTPPVPPVPPVTPPVTPPTITDIIKIISVVPIIDAIVNPPTPPTPPTFPIVDIPETWTPPVAPPVTPYPALTPIDFGNRNLLRGTQWEKFLDPNYGKVPAPVQYSQPSSLSYNDLMGILGSRQGMPARSNLSINDIISGIQNQYGQTPASTMG